MIFNNLKSSSHSVFLQPIALLILKVLSKDDDGIISSIGICEETYYML